MLLVGSLSLSMLITHLLIKSHLSKKLTRTTSSQEARKKTQEASKLTTDPPFFLYFLPATGYKIQQINNKYRIEKIIYYCSNFIKS